MRDWATQVETQQESRITVQKWCEENGITHKTNVGRTIRSISVPTYIPLQVILLDMDSASLFWCCEMYDCWY